MTRIAPLEPPYDAATEALLIKMMPPGAEVPPLAIFRTLARLPKVGKRLAGVGGALLTSEVLPLPLRELAILRTTARCRAEYEWGVHVSWLAQTAGLSREQVNDTLATTPDPAQWTDRQRAVLEAIDQLIDTATIDDTCYAALREHLDQEAILELVVVVGLYHLISFVARAADLPLEPWAARFDTRV